MRVRIPFRSRSAVVASVALGALLLAGCGDPDKEQTTLEANGPDARGSLDLLKPFFWIAVVIGVGVVAATIFLAWKFRYREGKNENPVQTHGNTVLEVTWTIVPALLLAVMAVFTVVEIVDQEWDIPAADEALDIRVIGRQWWWQYEYTEPDYQFYTANELHIPEDTQIHLRIDGDIGEGSNVNHSWWIPNLVGTKDYVPGRTHNLTFSADPGTAKPGQPRTFLGQCKEYCGLAHADMRLRVIVHTPDDYRAWVEEQMAATPELAEAAPDPEAAAVAALVKTYECASCHSMAENKDTVSDTGVPIPGDTGIGPNLAKVGSRQTIAGAKIDLNAADSSEEALENLTAWIYDAPAEKPAQCNHSVAERNNDDQACVGMPSMRKSGMTREQAQQIAQYLLENHK
jgi:cytochrome c oxidase subunit II